MDDRLWKEFHYWKWKKDKDTTFKIHRDKKTHRWILSIKKSGDKNWKRLGEKFRTNADAKIEAESYKENREHNEIKSSVKKKNKKRKTSQAQKKLAKKAQTQEAEIEDFGKVLEDEINERIN